MGSQVWCMDCSAISLLIGVLERRIVPILLGGVTFWLYGSALLALIPGISPAGVSWVGHAGGFLGGVLAAFAIRRDSDRSTQISGN